ncbi:putative nitrogen fixation protein NifT [Sulfurivermis fontis]|jgi:nitrogen fixation protein NifT|uniref:putative nitrogen fixation protein NifT n=1 Tax=Sulfurivermis fontis TaxID=1972068 RepID=UPI000FD93268|nr:putative nitrogen fixation protein NifT [Sulfurivermis fontis]
MPSVMIRQTADGKLSCYVAKKDLEETIETMEFAASDKWGGEVKLTDGSLFYIDPMPAPRLPITVRAKKL